MSNLVMGAMGNLILKLYELLKEEYNLQKGVKKRISSLTKELEGAQAALCKVAELPWDQLDKLVQLWAREVREASYNMEDVLDTFLVHVQGPDSANKKESLSKRLKKMIKLWKKCKTRRKIGVSVDDIMSHLQQVTERCRRYKVDDIVAKPASTPDPRLPAMYSQVTKFGMDKSSRELKSKLQLDDMSNKKMKIVSIVGIGGLGKTTLANAVYNNVQGDFDFKAFVSVGRNPNLQKVIQRILIDLDKQRYMQFNFAVLQDITQFINELREFLRDNKRYFIVIDDLWEKQFWETLKFAIPDDKSCEGRIIITTRKWEVAKNVDEAYELQPLPYESSRKLFYSRIYGDDVKYIDFQQPDEVCDQILKKCAGIPLAIITMASLLVDEPRDRWFEVYKSIGFGCKDNEDAENIMKTILSFSYYDLPLHLRTCLLYLSAFPEDSFVPKVPLVWMWVAEGFVQKREGKGLFETGQGYFNDLINRSLIQEQEPDNYKYYVHGCRVHDMVLDFVRSISCEENFFTVFDNDDQGTLLPGDVVRRLAHHNKTNVLCNQANNMFDMSKVRSFIALEWAIDTWAPISSFKLLRVLNIRYYGDRSDHSHIQVEHLGHLLHLRFLGIDGRNIQKIPEEIGALKMLQTLDLFGSLVFELPSSSSLPTQLVCLHIAFDYCVSDPEMFSVGRLTSLEELKIVYLVPLAVPRLLVKELGSLSELRVLYVFIRFADDEMLRDLVESVGHLRKLQHLQFCIEGPYNFGTEMELVLPGDLRYLALKEVALWKLPSCIDPLCHRKLSHLDLELWYMDEQELKTLGGLPELIFLGLDLSHASTTIRNISDSNACYFPKLRCLRLRRSLVLFVANKGDDLKKTVSFHIWDGEVDDSITMPPSVSDAGLQGDDELCSMFQCETDRGPVGQKSDDELQLLSVSDDVDRNRPSFQPSTSPVSDEEKKRGSISTREGDGEGAATPRFMPKLQVLHFQVREQAIRDPRYCKNLGLEFLSSLQEISVNIDRWSGATFLQVKQVEAALRSTAQVHPNHPTLHISSPYR